jgi:hypothetical protein
MKQIPLTKGQFALVDDEDFECLNQFKWHAIKCPTTYYACRKDYNKETKKEKSLLMHRFILGLTDLKIQGDHIDHNGLNNQRYNLRPSTGAQNARNKKAIKGTSSDYKGVYWCKAMNKWKATIKINQKSIHLGYFDDEIECAKAYDKKAIELFGEFAWLNFK